MKIPKELVQESQVYLIDDNGVVIMIFVTMTI